MELKRTDGRAFRVLRFTASDPALDIECEQGRRALTCHKIRVQVLPERMTGGVVVGEVFLETDCDDRRAVRIEFAAMRADLHQ
ncbi:MAG: hypothetical protein HYS13_01605 [Planctomycetia bacterium]|nr:hypothetical protein [Planctomycetia bacterium]